MEKVMLPKFLQEALSLAEDGKFENDVPYPIEEGENIVAEMTPFEKACLSHARSTIEQLEETTEITDVDSQQSLGEQAKLLGKLAWASINERVTQEEDWGGIGIRVGWKVVSLPKKDDDSCDCLLCRMRRGNTRLTVIGVGRM